MILGSLFTTLLQSGVGNFAAVVSLLAGLMFGAGINGANPWLPGASAAAFIAVLALPLSRFSHRLPVAVPRSAP